MVFDHNSRSRFFPDMWFLQKIRGPLVISCSSKTNTYEWIRLLSKPLIPHFWTIFGTFGGCPNQSVLVSEIGLPQFSYFTTIWFHAQNQKILMILIPHILHWERTIERTGEWSQIRITLRLARVSYKPRIRPENVLVNI